MRRTPFLTIAIAIAVFTTVAATSTGGWPLLLLAGAVTVAAVDGACRSLDRQSAAASRGAFVLESAPEIRIIPPIDQIASAN